MMTPTQESEMSSHLLAATFEGMPIAVLVTDCKGNIQLANPVACNILGMPKGALLGQQVDTVLGIWDAQQGSALALPIDQVVQLGLTLSRQDLVLTDGSTQEAKHFHVSLGPVKGSGQAVVGVMLTFDPVQKDASADRMGRKSELAALNQQFHSPQSLYVRTGGRYVRVFLSELLWVEAMENYVQLQTIHEKFVVHATLKSMVDALAGKGYQRIHRSFIVKKDEIERIEENQVLVHGTSLPIGKSYRAELLDSLTLI